MEELLNGEIPCHTFQQPLIPNAIMQLVNVVDYAHCSDTPRPKDGESAEQSGTLPDGHITRELSHRMKEES
jgi:hypothetical protein